MEKVKADLQSSQHTDDRTLYCVGVVCRLETGVKKLKADLQSSHDTEYCIVLVLCLG